MKTQTITKTEKHKQYTQQKKLKKHQNNQN